MSKIKKNKLTWSFLSSQVIPLQSELEMQRYTIWMYQYIVTCVSRYSDILHDTTKCKFTAF